MSPAPLIRCSPMKEAITALEEQVKTRVVSVEMDASIRTAGAWRSRYRTVDRSSKLTALVRLFDAVARSASAHCHRCGARVPGSRRAAARAVRDAEGQERY